MSSDETVAVVVVTYNSEALLPDLVASLGPGLAGVAWHLTFADNASADSTVAALRRIAPQATVVEMGRNAGYAAGINAAVAASRPHTAVLILNPDVRLDPGCGVELLAALRRTGAGIVVPQLRDGSGVLIPNMRREPSLVRALSDLAIGANRAGRIGTIGEVVTDERRYATETVTDWAEGSTQLVDAACLRESGPWDESFFLYSEETEFALRARDAGWSTRYVPTAHATHLEGDSAHAPRLWTLVILNRLRLYRRRHGRISSYGYWSALFLRELSRALMGKQTSRMAARALLSPARLRERPGPSTVHPGP